MLRIHYVCGAQFRPRSPSTVAGFEHKSDEPFSITIPVGLDLCASYENFGTRFNAVKYHHDHG